MTTENEMPEGSPGTMLCVLQGVREHGEGDPVELWRTLSGRLVIRAYSESHNASSFVDLWDLLDWLRTGETK